jgi:hypothetical protein
MQGSISHCSPHFVLVESRGEANSVLCTVLFSFCIAFTVISLYNSE